MEISGNRNGSNNLCFQDLTFLRVTVIISNSTIEFKWNDNLNTRIGLFYEGRQGDPFQLCRLLVTDC
jgi:hypothetical protein